jgi:hypothetical protein
MTSDISQVDQSVVKIVELANKVSDNYWDLGEALAIFKSTQQYKFARGPNGEAMRYYSLSHSSWKLFCTEMIPVSYRTAQYWITMYEYFTKMNINKDDLKGIGWSKAKELVNFSEEQTEVLEALEYAKEHTINELRLWKEGKQDSQADDELKARNFNFKLIGMHAQGVDQVLQAAINKHKIDKNEALFKIFIEWYQMTKPEVRTAEVTEVFGIEK